MLSTSIARRYAAAFFEIAQGRNELGEMEAQLQDLVSTINGNRELKRVFYHRLIKENDKRAIVQDIFGKQISPILLYFINLLIIKKRELYLESILTQYVLLANAAQNIMDANVTSAVKIAPADLKDLQERLSELTGKKVRLKPKEDPSLIGGLVIRVGDRVIDGSIKKQLQMLKGDLMKAQLRFS